MLIAVGVLMIISLIILVFRSLLTEVHIIRQGNGKSVTKSIDINTNFEIRIQEVSRMQKSQDSNIPVVAVNDGIISHVKDLFVGKFGQIYYSKDVASCKSCRCRRLLYAVLESGSNSVFIACEYFNPNPGFHLDNKIFLSEEAAQKLGITDYKNMPYSVKFSKFFFMCEEEATTFAYARRRAKDNAYETAVPISENLKREVDEILKEQNFGGQ